MSDALTMLAGGFTELLSQFGRTYTVSGRSGTFSGIIETPLVGTILDIDGERPDDSATLLIPQSATYVPVAGDYITILSKTWVVTGNTQHNDGFYSVPLRSRHR